MGTAADIEARVNELEKDGVLAGANWREQWRRNDTLAGGIKDNAEDIEGLKLQMARLGPYIALAAAIGALLGGGVVTIVLKVGFGI